MKKNISILATSLLLLAGCEKYEGDLRVNDSPAEQALEDAAEEVIESLFPISIELDLSKEKEEEKK